MKPVALIAALSGAIVFSAPAMALGSDLQKAMRKNCMKDVQTYCSDYVRKPEKLVSCLLENDADISPACSEVNTQAAKELGIEIEPVEDLVPEAQDAVSEVKEMLPAAG